MLQHQCTNQFLAIYHLQQKNFCSTYFQTKSIFIPVYPALNENFNTLDLIMKIV